VIFQFTASTTERKKTSRRPSSVYDFPSLKSRAEDALDHGANVASIIRVDVEGQGDYDVSSQAHATLEVVALAISDQVVNDQHGKEEDDGLEALEVQGHGLADDPAEDDEEGSDEKGDLHAAANRDTDGQVHLVLVGDDAGGDVLGGVADNREEDQTDEGLADVEGVDDCVDGVDQVFGADSDCECDENQADGGWDGTQDLRLLLSTILTLLLLLGVEQVCVGLQLEEQVEAVEDEHDDGGAVRQDKDVIFRVGGAAAEGSVKGRRNDKGGSGDGHERCHGGCDGCVEGALGAPDSGGDEAAAQDEQDVGEDGTEHAGLDNADLALPQRNDTNLD
jgi:hypothetical protein